MSRRILPMRAKRDKQKWMSQKMEGDVILSDEEREISQTWQ